MGEKLNIEELLQKYLDNRCTPEEADAVLQWLSEGRYEIDGENIIRRLLQSNPEVDPAVSEKLEKKLRFSFEKITRKIPEKKAGKRKHLLPYLAAATIIITVSIFFIIRNQHPRSEDLVLKNAPIVPGGNKAILTLADGRQVILEEAKDGKLAKEGGTTIEKAGDKLVYSNTTNEAIKSGYNTIRTPRGGQYRVELPDGSVVTLNAASSISFLASFDGRERLVTLTGEAYFEVAPLRSASNQKIPFLVKTGDYRVTVLGTHFNINAYDDEDAIRTTLIEGSVKVNNDENEIRIQPGQQAKQKNGTKLLQITHPDLEEVLAWKNEKFLFNNTDAKAIMRQLSRWYDIDIEYKDDLSGIQYSGGLSKKDQIEKLIELLELEGRMKFEIKGRKLIVMKNQNN